MVEIRLLSLFDPTESHAFEVLFIIAEEYCYGMWLE